MTRIVHHCLLGCTSLAWLLLCPVLEVAAVDPSPSAGIRDSGQPPLLREVSSGDQSLYEEHEFAQRYNKLVLALQNFSESYNSGHVIDVKRVKAIKKAWRELEKSDWFKPDSTN